MIVLFVTIILVYLKNNFLYESGGYPYILALGLPVIILTSLASVFIYKTYISKLEQSHRNVYISLLTLLVLVSVAFIAFILMFSIFLSKPDSMKTLAMASVVPYYIVLLITIGFFVYISPGLLDKINGIPKY